MSDELSNGVLITITSSSGVYEYTAVNQPTLTTLLKLGDDNKTLGSVQFKIERKNDNGQWERLNPDDTYVTSPTGLIQIRGLEPGTYRMVEIFTPDGYVLSLPVEFTVTEDSDGHVGPFSIGPLVNEDFYGRLVIYKTDASYFKPLAGATYNLYDGNGKLLMENIVTGANGMVTVDHLAAGDYQLIETKGPDGYDIDHLTHKFSITYNMQAIQVITLNLTDPLLPGTPTTNVPQTGDDGDTLSVVVLVLSILAVLGGGILLWRNIVDRKKAKKGGVGK